MSALIKLIKRILIVIVILIFLDAATAGNLFHIVILHFDTFFHHANLHGPSVHVSP